MPTRSRRHVLTTARELIGGVTRAEVASAASLVAVALLLAVLSVTTVLSASRFRRSLEQLEHAQLVGLAAERFTTRFEEAQSTRRALLLTGDTAFLGMHRAARERSRRELDALHSLLPASEANRQALLRIAALQQDLDTIAAAAIAWRLDYGIAPSGSEGRTREGQPLVAAVERELATLTSSLSARHRADLVRATARARRAERAALSSGVLALLVVPLAVIVIVRGLQARRTQREARNAAEATAAAATRDRSVLLDRMGREIRTPVDGALQRLDVALATASEGEWRKHVLSARRSVQALGHLVDELLDLSRFESDRVDLDRVAFSVRDTIADALQPFAARVEATGRELAYRVAPEVPDRVVGDVAKFRQVLTNLVDNAVTFTEHGEIVVGVDAPGGSAHGAMELQVSVRDTGTGIAPSRLGSIFEPFVDTDRTAAPADAHAERAAVPGLGLAISQRLVRLMGGRIRAESTPGVGSTFHFTVMLGLAEDTTDGGSPRPPELDDLAVLVVDDHEANRRILEELFLTWRMQPTVVATGVAALRAASERRRIGAPFAAALLDSGLPDMDGFALAAELTDRHLLRSRAIIMLSPSSERVDRERGERLRLGATLAKPARQSAIFEAIARAATGPRGEPALAAAVTAEVAAPVAEPGRLQVAAGGSAAVRVDGMLELVGGDGELLSIIARDYLSQAPPLVAVLRSAVDAGDAPAARQAAQRLKGSSAQLAATPVVAAAAMLETMASEGSLDGAAVLVTEIEIAVDDLRALLERQVLGGTGPGVA